MFFVNKNRQPASVFYSYPQKGRGIAFIDLEF